MEGETRSIRLDLCFDDGSPAGRATACDGATRRFAGWLGLMAAVEALVGDGAPVAEQAKHPDEHDDDRPADEGWRRGRS